MACDPIDLATEGVRGLRPYEPGKPIAALRRELGLDEIVKLASNESALGTGSRARAAIAGCLRDVARYPDGGGFALKCALSQRLAVAPECITLGNGSNDVLELVARAFVTPEHEVLFSEHAFAVYPIVTQAVGARAVITPAHDWGHDLAAMRQAIGARTRLVFIANPNNPTGTWLRRDALRAFIAAVPEDVLVVVDEAYREYVTQPDYPDCSEWLPAHRNLIVTRTFSKAHGLAGLRVGYSLSDPVVADLLNRVRQPFNVNSIALTAAEAALHDDGHVAECVRVNESGLRQLGAAFEEMGLEYIPSVANFISVAVGQSGTRVFEGLLRHGVIVRPIAGYGMPRHLRVTVGLEHENARFISALRTVLGERGEA